MSALEQVWRGWRTLSRADRARFLIMLRDAYAREREADLDDIPLRQGCGMLLLTAAGLHISLRSFSPGYF